MSKKACKKKGFENKENAKYECKKCGARVNKEEKVCKAKRIKEARNSNINYQMARLLSENGNQDS